ncbi:hypothetical protein [Synechococcus sp. PCC 7336]|uniref:hypothetical protein n=1 Tax=Synechococcus sp. PCC 7336 TaxID=195250 RepID=UPI000345814C|nr:hypothetical protein [Synechococcus sp. PCC 7336]
MRLGVIAYGPQFCLDVLRAKVLPVRSGDGEKQGGRAIAACDLPKINLFQITQPYHFKLWDK